jgi:hypothetical protein
VWNIQSYENDSVGAGFIISPVNTKVDDIQRRFDTQKLQNSWFDPQFYLPQDSKSKLETYPFFPGNKLDNFNTSDYIDYSYQVAKECLNFQHEHDFKYLVVPTRYYDDLPEHYIQQMDRLFLDTFVNARKELGFNEPLILTVIAKEIHLELEPGYIRDELLTWVTSESDISGVYLIFDNNFQTKQIKDADYLYKALLFIQALRYNNLEVHIGYSGIEGLLYSIADPTSISVGSYENLRSFNLRRFQTLERRGHRGPNPRIYSGDLLQWIEDSYLPPFRKLVPDWTTLFNYSPYREYLLDEESELNFNRRELYKHYFYIFSDQIAELPPVNQRPNHIRDVVHGALSRFEFIRENNVFLDANSDGSHLPAWLNALAMYESDQ